MKNNIFLTSDGATVIEDVIKHFDFNNKKKTLFIETSGETHEGKKPWIDNAKKEMERLGFDMTYYTITEKSENEIETILNDFDVVYMAGGNTMYLLKKSQECNFKKCIEKFIKRRGVYIGQSAGSIITGPNIKSLYELENDDFFKELNDYDGYGLVDFVTIPHFGDKSKKEERFFNVRFKHMYGSGYKIFLLTDQQYIRIQEDGMYKIEEV